MRAFQVLAALIAGASAAAIHNETAQSWEIAEKASNTEIIWNDLMGAKGNVSWYDPYIKHAIGLKCRTASNERGQVCCRTEPELKPVNDRSRAGANMCETIGKKKHHFNDVKRKADYSATYMGNKKKSPQELSPVDCHTSQQVIKTDCATQAVLGQTEEMTYGGWYKEGDWVYSVNIPLDGKENL